MVAEFDKINPSRPRLDRFTRAIYEGVTDQILKAFPSRPPAFSDRHIDDAINDTIIKTIEATQKGRKPKISSREKVSKAIQEYVTGITGKWLDNLKKGKPRSSTALEKEFSKAVAGQQPEPGEGEIFHETNDSMIRKLADIVWIGKAERVGYLSPLLDPLAEQGRLTIATLNYDNAVELMAESHGTEVSTGIEAWSETGAFDFSGDGLHLLKLHGSIDWSLIDGQVSSERPMPHQAIRRVSEEGMREVGFRPAVVFGQRNKLTAEGPFLDLLRAFRDGLAEADRLTVIGYSFRDPHINEYLTQWLNESEGHRIRVIDPGFESNREPYAEELKTHGWGRMETISKGAKDGLLEGF